MIRIFIFVYVIPILSLLSIYFANMKNESIWRDFLIENFQDLKASDIKKLKLKDICFDEIIKDTSFCITQNHLDIVKKVDFAVIILSTGILGFVWVLGKIGKTSRFLLHSLFYVSFIVINLLLIALLISNSLIFAGTVYYIMRVFFERLAIGLVIATGLACLIGIIRIIYVLSSVFYQSELKVFGIKIDLKNIPPLRDAIRRVEKEVSSISINNVLVGLEPNFFVTNSSVKYDGGTTNNGTLYLSLPLLRNLQTEELLAVLAHEYAHITGKDTVYSEKFYRLYRGMELGIQNAENSESVLFLPVIGIFAFFLYCFSFSERKISREREIEADSVAVSLFGSKNLISALIKVQVMNIIWNEVIDVECQKLKNNQTISNISFACSYIFETQLLEYLNNLNLNANIPHPLDTHPTINERAKKLEVSLKEVYETLAVQDKDIFFKRLSENEVKYFEDKEAEVSNEVASTLASAIIESLQSEQQERKD